MIKSFIRNPLSISILAVFLGFILMIFVNDKTSADPLQAGIFKVLDRAGVILFSTGLLGIFIEHFSKLSLIQETVERTVGNTKALIMGITDIVPSASDINYSEDIALSSELIVTSRYSVHFLDKNRDAILKRVKAGKKITFIQMSEESLKGIKRTYSRGSAKEWFNITFSDNPEALRSCFVIKTDSYLTYNIVSLDKGIWVKQYWNCKAKGMETPPAYFVSRNSDFYNLFRRDLEKLMEECCVS